MAQVVATGERGGVLLQLGEAGGELGFVPAEIARRLTPLSSLTAVPGVMPPVMGIALADGAVVTVLRVGPIGAPTPSRTSYTPGEDWTVPGADRALLCTLGGVDVALTGATVLATGVFDGAPGGDGVLWRSEVVPILDVRALYAQAEAASWAARAATHPVRAALAGARAEDEGTRGFLPEAPGEDSQRGSGR